MSNSEKTDALIRNAMLIAGPTASGKSALALGIAQREGRAIVNADSMQVYDVLRVLTARPSQLEMSKAPHYLYGHVPPGSPYSVGNWIEDVRRIASTGAFEMAPPIFVGGTGLYFRALCQGLADIPTIPTAIRKAWRRRLGEEGSLAAYQLLSNLDQRAASGLRPSDGQRIVRALEVYDSTGISIVDWQAKQSRPLIDNASATKVVFNTKRDVINRRIDERFDAMMTAGALDEVSRLAHLNLPSDATAMKAIGVPQLLQVLRGEMSLEAAVQKAKVASRQYAKRQATWFRNQFGTDWERRSAD